MEKLQTFTITVSLKRTSKADPREDPAQMRALQTLDLLEEELEELAGRYSDAEIEVKLTP